MRWETRKTHACHAKQKTTTERKGLLHEATPRKQLSSETNPCPTYQVSLQAWVYHPRCIIEDKLVNKIDYKLSWSLSIGCMLTCSPVLFYGRSVRHVSFCFLQFLKWTLGESLQNMLGCPEETSLVDGLDIMHGPVFVEEQEFCPESFKTPLFGSKWFTVRDPVPEMVPDEQIEAAGDILFKGCWFRESLK